MKKVLLVMAIMIAIGLSGCIVVLQPDVAVSGYWGPRSYPYGYGYSGYYSPRYDGGYHGHPHTHCDYTGCWSHSHPHGEGAYGHHH